jgi:periplasmic divalent cation tolerance protein
MAPRVPASRIAVVLVTCPRGPAAERIARTLVSERLAACANAVPGLTSTYRWEGKVCRDAEVLLIIKTRRRLLPGLIDRIKALHPYSVPEIIALPLVGGSPAYLGWVAESTRHPAGSASSSRRPRE